MFRRIGVYRTFITGILIGLFFVVIVSEKASKLLIFADQGIIDQRVFVLTFSGILGGILYTIIVDGVVELPRFSKDGYSFEAGLLGDILLGIAGAFILEFLTSSMQASPGTSYVISAAKGIIGGYGSKALMNIALNKFVQQFEEMKEEKKAAERKADGLERQISEGHHLFDLVNAHIKNGISQSELEALKQEIRNTSHENQLQIFKITKEFRRMSSRTDLFKSQTQRTIPIFLALVNSDPANHEYHAQLAFAYKDAEKPEFLRAINHLDRAISLRGEDEQASTWKYELNRAIAHIQITHSETGSYVASSSTNQTITHDLLTVLRQYSLDHILKNAAENNIPTPILEWIIDNQEFLKAHHDAHLILVQLKDVIRDDRLVMTTGAVSLNTTPTNSQSNTGDLTGEGDRHPPHSTDHHHPQPSNITPSIPTIEPVIDAADSDRELVTGSLTEHSDPTFSTNISSTSNGAIHENAPTIKEEIEVNTANLSSDSEHLNSFELDYIKNILKREVTGILPIEDWPPDLFKVVKIGLIQLKLLEEDSFEAFQEAWAAFKASVDRGGPTFIGKDSADLFLIALEKTQHSHDLSTEKELTKQEEVILQSGIKPSHSETLPVPPVATPFSTEAETSGSNKTITIERSRWDDVLPDTPTHGASSLTSKQDGLSFSGLLASNQMARHDLPRVEKLVDRFCRAAKKFDVPAPLLAAIASRESRCGSLLDKNGMGDHGNAFGIMQIDKRHHTPAGLGGDPASQAHIDQAAEILADNLKRLRAIHSTWESGYLLKGAVAAYNFGIKNVRTKEGIDSGTTGDDYGSDVVARAKFYIPLFEK